MCSTSRIHHQAGHRHAAVGGISESLDSQAWARFARIANEAEWRRQALRRFGRYPASHETDAPEADSKDHDQ